MRVVHTVISIKKVSLPISSKSARKRMTEAAKSSNKVNFPEKSILNFSLMKSVNSTIVKIPTMALSVTMVAVSNHSGLL